MDYLITMLYIFSDRGCGMTGKKKLPMGFEDFERIRRDGFYYVDKTKFIRTLLQEPAYVNLFTRPRRFGKTLNMSTLKHFFQIGSDNTLFDGLEISREKELCKEYMGKYPVISISLKGVEGNTFHEAKGMLRSIIRMEAMRFQFLVQSQYLSETEQQDYKALIHMNEEGIYTMPDELLKNSLFLLSSFLKKHYNQRVIILIDEYDVPLDKAYHAGYYDEMVKLIRGLFGQALKTNENLYFAVLTGCLRISIESNVSVKTETSEKRSRRFSQTSPKRDVLFTGINNFTVHTVKDVQYNDVFGFTDTEVREMLAYYEFTEKYAAIKEWYDGYRFGNLEVYCPWDVVSYCYTLKSNPFAKPQSYWVNTSSNDIVRKLIYQTNPAIKNEIEQLINGSSVKKEIHQELTYRDLNSDIDNLWSLLFTTGYLTQCGEDEDGMTQLVIPNKEIRWIYRKQIQEWFEVNIRKDTQKLEKFCQAFLENDTATIERNFTSYLRETISIRDTNVKKDMKENFYHGILLGLLGYMEYWSVRSNVESGEGYSDIIIEAPNKSIGIVIELKYAENAAFEEYCQKALQQIKDKNYEETLLDDGLTTIYRYGIACYKKRCKVISG